MYGRYCFVVVYFQWTSFYQLPSCCMVLLTIWCLVACLIVFLFANGFVYGCLLICFVFFALLAWIDIDWFINRLIDWRIDPSLIDWLIDRSINRLIDWSFGWWLTGSSASFLRSPLLVLFYSLPCAHVRWDPYQFLLALRGFVELISVMVRFRSSVLFRPAWRWLKNTPSGAIGETHRKEPVRETVWQCGTWSSPMAPIYV